MYLRVKLPFVLAVKGTAKLEPKMEADYLPKMAEANEKE